MCLPPAFVFLYTVSSAGHPAFHRCQYLHTDHRHFIYFCRTDHRYDYFHPEFPADGTQAYTLQSGTGTSGPGRVMEFVFDGLDSSQKDLDYIVATG